MSTKLTDLAALGTTPASGDYLTVVDVSDITGGAAGTSKKVTYSNLGVGGTVVSVKVTLDNADVLTMKYNNTPITLKAAEASKIIVPVSCVCVATHAGSDETSSDDLRLGWDAAASTTIDRWGESRDWMIGITSGTLSTCFGGASSAGSSQTMTFSLINAPFQIWCTDNFTGGWSMDVYFSYYIAHI
jgi:hypothetical protein